MSYPVDHFEGMALFYPQHVGLLGLGPVTAVEVDGTRRPATPEEYTRCKLEFFYRKMFDPRPAT